MGDAILVEDVHFSYEGLPVLQGVTLTVRTGEVLAIMGENGAGKTTLIKHFVGLLKPERGRVLVFGVDTREASVAQLARRVGVVFQNPDHQLFAESVEGEILFTLRNMGYPPDEARAICERVLKLFELDRYRGRSPYSLSVGERKRLAIAAVVSYNPDVLVLDEPTAGQDFFNKSKISRLIFGLKRQGKGVVVVTHDVEFAAQVADRVALMVDGRVIREGPAGEVLTDAEALKRARLTMPQIPAAAALLEAEGLKLPSKPLLPGPLYLELLDLLNHRWVGP
ncbi:MAG: energy-coupling factor ABC transporter ATP-binding protein [Thermofilum sp.]|nr:energy-coupling factor ABC transporter ATP-binding protein [Thermofilum sp.]